MKRQVKPASDVPRSKVSLYFSEPDEIGVYCFLVPFSCLSAFKEQAVAYGGQLDSSTIDPLLYCFSGENSHLNVMNLALPYMFFKG